MDWAFNKPGRWARRVFAGCILEECNCCCILWKVTAVVGNITFYKYNEWACDGDLDNTFHTWLQLLSCVCLNSLPTKYRLYLLNLNDLHFWSLSDCKQSSLWPFLRKKNIPLCTLLEFYTNKRQIKQDQSFQNALFKCLRALNITFLKTSYLRWISSFFSLSSHLKNIRIHRMRVHGGRIRKEKVAD